MSDKLAINIDWLATLAEIVGFDVDDKIDGKSLTSMIPTNKKVRDEYFWKHYKKGWALRKGKWNLIKNVFNPYTTKKYDTYSLYDIESDMTESYNLIKKEKKVFQSLLKKAQAYKNNAKPFL